ncbi:MAG: 23S rRNA (uracil(1939)-C(5))-methyltransferase RlmD [Clostridiales bacterium]|jgi:23S rRNA (uracil-5-)-methyltransferase RumA|nr:23S rRNA (uracil(1939)-C(5))-methyltransferase RlmD [Clostridiales bacterium]
MSKKKKYAPIFEENEIIDNECIEFPMCGGCAFRNINYSSEISYKENFVKNLIETFGNFENMPIVCAENVFEYRNKMEFSFGDNGTAGELAVGMRKHGSFYEVSDGTNCVMCDDDFRVIAKTIKEFFKETGAFFYHKRKQTGTLRNLIIRKAFFTGEIIVNVVTTSNLADISPLKEKLCAISLKGTLKGLLHTICDCPSDAVKPEKITLIFGENFITEKINGLIFKISPFSFFQTNSCGAEKLYQTVTEFAGDLSGEVVFDLYCGTGTISQILAKKNITAKIIGVEIVDEAIQAAKQNAALNNIKNCEFISGDVLKIVPELQKPGTIIVDPPRDGIHPKVLPHLINFNAEKIVYVSCNPKTLARDLESFTKSDYQVKKVRIHDMFPRTNHVETVVQLSR